VTVATANSEEAASGVESVAITSLGLGSGWCIAVGELGDATTALGVVRICVGFGLRCRIERGAFSEPSLTTLRLSCIADDAQGEQIEVLWDAEIGAKIIQDDTWSQVGRGAPDSPEVLAAYLRAIRWRSATAADRDLLQSPFGAGIRLDHYQLLPCAKPFGYRASIC
jgi:hypothetical protein